MSPRARPTRLTAAALALALGLSGCGSGARTTSLGAIAPPSMPQAAAAVSRLAPSVTVAAHGLPFVGFVPTDLPAVGPPLVVPTSPRQLIAASAPGNEAVLSVSPAETLPAVRDFINGAQHTLWIEMFELGGTYGQKIIPLVLARAHAGVNVRLLLDQMGSSSQAKGIKPFAAELAAAGVQVVFYPARLRDDQHGDLRFNLTHRKLLLADGCRALEGGTNLGTDFDTTEQDLMVRWRGPVVGDLYREFGSEWRFIGAGPLPLPSGPFPSSGNVDAQVAVTSTPDGRFEIRDTVYAAIDGAKHEITIEQQYLWDQSLVSHLLAALKRGVRLRAIVPGGTAEKLTLWSLNMEAVHQLVLAGAEARGFYNPLAPEAHLHTKYFAVDGHWVEAGSANGDERSFLDHQELDVISTEPGFVKEMGERVFEHDWASESKPFVYQPASPFASPFRGLLDELSYLF